MKLHIAVMGSFLALAACGGSGATLIGGGTGDDDTTGGIGGGTDVDGGGGGGSAGDTCAGDYICSGDVVAVRYNETADVLSITGTPFDETPLAGTYVRAPSADVPGFLAYTNNDDLAFDLYIAYHKTSPGGEVSVGSTGIEGYRGFGYSGTFIEINDPAGIPGEALVQFEGQSAGLIAFDNNGTLLQSWANVILQVDTTDNYAKGFIVDRNWRDPLTGETGTLTGMVLNDTTISGTKFSGSANSYNAGETIESGTYTGYFVGDSDIVAGKFTGTGTADDIIAGPGFTESADGAFPAGDGITARDQQTFIADEVPHGPLPNPLLP